MYYGRGFGRGFARGYGRGMGLGFRGSSPPWPYVGIGRGGLPRCWTYGGYGGPVPGYALSPYPPAPGPWASGRGSYGAPSSQEDEVRFLKDQGDMIREELEAIDARIKELEKDKSSGGEA